jgi:hypothetical protein
MSEEAIGSHRPQETHGRMVMLAPPAEPEAQKPGLVTQVRDYEDNISCRNEKGED